MHQTCQCRSISFNEAPAERGGEPGDAPTMFTARTWLQ